MCKKQAYRKRHHQRLMQNQIAWRAANKIKVSAHRKVRLAIKSGALIRPGICSGCGVSCRPDAHHHDYSKPLDVIWLCKKCHFHQHPDAMGQVPKLVHRGETHATAKLKEKQVIEIIELLKTQMSGRAIARAFGTDEANIRLIKNNKAWKHLPRT